VDGGRQRRRQAGAPAAVFRNNALGADEALAPRRGFCARRSTRSELGPSRSYYHVPLSKYEELGIPRNFLVPRGK
jgi:hypothetical protein